LEFAFVACAEAGPHRNFDQIDHDFNLLMREVRQNDRQSSVQSIQRLSDVTKTERDDCIRICDDIQRLVQKRRQKIQELLQQHQKQNSGIVAAGGKNGEPLKASPVLQRKVSARALETSIIRLFHSAGALQLRRCSGTVAVHRAFEYPYACVASRFVVMLHSCDFVSVSAPASRNAIHANDQTI
jgi:hypothetical protein